MTHDTTPLAEQTLAKMKGFTKCFECKGKGTLYYKESGIKLSETDDCWACGGSKVNVQPIADNFLEFLNNYQSLLEQLKIAKEALQQISDGHGCELHQCGLIAQKALSHITI